jgi:delta1-piperideine-2-carboxylate reductase
MLSIEAHEDDGGAKAAPHGGELILALDPARFGDPEGFMAHGERLFAAILAQEGTRLPGARRHQNRAKSPVTGVAIPRSLHETIVGLIQN